MRLYEAARKYVGVAFRHQGRNRKEGLDCIGLVIVALEDMGVAPRDRTDYDPVPDGHTLIHELREQLVRVEVTPRPEPDTIVAMNRLVARCSGPRHIGIVSDHGLIHTYAGIGRVVEHVIDERWSKLFTSCWRLPEAWQV